MLKAKQMPKKKQTKQTKQTKKPTKNDGKITKKKYIKTKIIGGQMIQMLTLQQKLDFLKDCLKKYVYNINFNTGSEYFQYYLDDETINRPFNDYFLEKFKPHDEKVKDFIGHLQFILLCLYNHYNYDSYTLLKLYYKDYFKSDQNNLFDTIEIDNEKKEKLESEASTYYKKYVDLLNGFINKIISVANPSVTVAEAPDPGGALSVDDPDGAQGGEETGGQGEGGERGEGVAQGGEQQRGGVFGIPSQLLYTQPKTAISPEESEKKIFETSMFKIYNDGIVLLTIDEEEAYNLKVFKSIDNKEGDDISDEQGIINFLNNNKDSLIIRIYKNPENNNHFYDCQLQLMYKLVNILIKNIDDYKKAIQTQLETNLKKPEFLLNYKTNLLDKLIVIIFEKFKAKKTEYAKELKELKSKREEDEKKHYGGSGPGEYVTGSILRHGIILQSLKVIAYNNKIENSDIESKYSEIFEEFFPDKEDISKIVEISKDIPKYGSIRKQPSCPNRKEFFQHIINVIYDPESKGDNQTNIENIETLTKLSTSMFNNVIGGDFGDKDCETTIKKIIEEKGYLISEASIQASELKEKYKLDSNAITPENAAKMNTEFNNYNELITNYINDDKDGLNLDKKYETTKKAILKIYGEFRTHFDNKITMFSLKEVNLLKPITATKVAIP